MKAKAIASFAGLKYSAIPGDEIDICEKEIYEDLLSAGYIEPAEGGAKPEAKAKAKAEAKPKATRKRSTK